MKKNYYLITIIVLLLIANSCSKDEEVAPEAITTDISVTSSENLIFWEDDNELTLKLNNALSYNYGNALESEIEK